jgi:hypothetical protein
MNSFGVFILVAVCLISSVVRAAPDAIIWRGADYQQTNYFPDGFVRFGQPFIHFNWWKTLSRGLGINSDWTSAYNFFILPSVDQYLFTLYSLPNRSLSISIRLKCRCESLHLPALHL